MSKIIKTIAVLAVMMVSEMTYAWTPITTWTAPHDVATLEALIAQHKGMMEVMNDKIDVASAVLVAQEFNTSETKKWSSYKDKVREKVKNAWSYIRLVWYFTQALEKSKKIYEQQKELLNMVTSSKAAKKPSVWINYYSTEQQFKKDMETVAGKIAAIAASETGIIYANEQQRLDMLFDLNRKLDITSYNLHQGWWSIRLAMRPTADIVKSIGDFIDSKAFDDIADQVIEGYANS